MPETGAPVATEKPAQAPPVIVYLSQALCFLVNANTLPRPIAVPIWTDGPSLPKGIPIKKLVRDIRNVPISVLSHLKVIIPRKIPIEVGIPPPPIFGSLLYINAKRIDKPKNAIITIGKRYRWLFRYR